MTQTTSRSFNGRFSDGLSVASHDVAVVLRGKNLDMTRQDGGPPIVWPLATVATAEPLSPRSHDVLILEPTGRHGRSHATGATLFVADATFVHEFAKRAPHVTARAKRLQGLTPFFWVVFVVGGAIALITVTDFSPARSLAALLPRPTRMALGEQVIQSMTNGHRVCQAPAGKQALTKLAARLSAASGGLTSFDVVVIESPVINAFAAPGEQIVIMSKLIEKAGGGDEVAGVLAHEMGHGLELHPEAGLIRSAGLMAITEFAFGGTGATIANVGLYLAQLGYSRQAERQADTHGLRILRAAGISNRGIIDFFERMAKNDGAPPHGELGAADSALAMLRTHPSVAERLASLRSQMPYATSPALTDSEWQALRTICSDEQPALPKQPKRLQPPAKGPIRDRDI